MNDPLAPTIQTDLTEKANWHKANLRQCIAAVNASTERVFRQTPAELQAWLNSTDPAVLNGLLTRHATAGAAHNIVAASEGIAERVDTDPFTVQGAKRGLSITQDETGWTVTPIPQPEPSPAPEE